MAAHDLNGDALSDKLRTLSMGQPSPDPGALPVINTPKKDSSQHQAASAPSTVLVPKKTTPRRSPSSSRFNHIVPTPTSKDKRSVSAASAVASPSSPKNTSRRSSSTVITPPSSAIVPRPETGLDETAETSPSAASVARAHFRQELNQHDQPEIAGNVKTVVIMHDSCYGHRYSRPRTTKANLSTIVERPERVHASLLGVAAAYVRLGRKHSEAVHSNGLETKTNIPAGLPFRIQKTARSVPLTSPVVTNIHGARWMEELKTMCEVAESKLALSGKELVRPDAENVSNEPGGKPKLHEGDLYLCSESLDALQGAIGGVCDGVDAVFSGKGKDAGARRSFVCIRPPGHHCSSNYPSGFCWLNNVHVGISHASMMHGLTHAAIVDFDLHHGDGSQAITWEHNAKVARLPKNAANSKKTAIGYFSLHDINSYPCEMGDEEKIRNASVCVENAHGQTIWNVHLDPWKDENEFWSIYESKYSILIDKVRTFLSSHTERLKSSITHSPPKAAIFMSAGFDASEWESSGMQRHKVNVPTSFYARFTRDIVMLSEEAGTGADGRIVSVLEGGYSDRALTSGVLSHLSGLAADESLNESDRENGLGREMGKRIGTYDEQPEDTEQAPIVELKPEWWDILRLEELEAVVNPTLAPPVSRKPRNASRPTYSSTTQSFNAKIVPGSTVYRNVSAGSLRTANITSSRAPIPPQPDINWSTAAHELSKLLIPTDRQTLSCRPEDLSAPASRGRRERHSIGLPSDLEVHDGRRMQLRERKIKTPNYTLEEEEEEEQLTGQRPAPKPNRRTTIGGAAIRTSKPTTKSETTRAEKSKPSTTNKRRPSVSSSHSAGDSAILPLTHETNGTVQAANERPTIDGHYPDNLLGVPSESYSGKQVVAGKFRNVSGPRTENARNRPSKKVTPAVKGSSAKSDTTLKSSSPIQSTITKTHKNMQNPKLDEKQKDIENLVSDLKELSMEKALPVKTQGAKNAVNAGEGISSNQNSPNTFRRHGLEMSLSTGEPLEKDNPETLGPLLSDDVLERGKPKNVPRNDDVLADELDFARSPQLAARTSRPRPEPETPVVVDTDPGSKVHAEYLPGPGNGTLEPSPASTATGTDIGVPQELSQSNPSPIPSTSERELPVFTADSHIPFGKVNGDGSNSKAEQPPPQRHLTPASDTTRTPLDYGQGGSSNSRS